MTEFISVRPTERGAAVITLSPVDEDGVALLFAQLTAPKWQLMRTDGTVVNSRTFAASVLTSLEFVLKGADLAFFGPGDNKKRVLSFQATYDSTAGDDLPLNDECTFAIEPLLGQTDV